MAASSARDCLVFTNTTATVGKTPRTVYTNTKVMTREGQAVPDLTVTVSIGGDQRVTEHTLTPWGVTDLIRHDFPGQGMDPTTIQFHATAPGHTPITHTVTLTPPAWWKE
ncbi:hypothetical protein ABZ546_13815 [Brachybacterium paraconglomeratum]